jgi:hypothetical protein
MMEWLEWQTDRFGAGKNTYTLAKVRGQGNRVELWTHTKIGSYAVAAFPHFSAAKQFARSLGLTITLASGAAAEADDDGFDS